MKQMSFSSFPLINGYSKAIHVYENIFEKYLKRAYFVNEKINITVVFRPYKYEDFLTKIFSW